MNRFFVDKQNILEGEEIIIVDDHEDVKHISKVLRLKEKDPIEICDGDNNEYIGEISSIEKTRIVLKILLRNRVQTEPSIQVDLYQGIPKSTKMELIIQKCTEMGISSIIPLITNRTVVQLKDKKAEGKKGERWQKIANEAAKQCKRGVIPNVLAPTTFKDMLNHVSHYDIAIILYENEGRRSMKEVLKAKQQFRKIAIIIGPEGGFEEEEVMSAKNNGILPVTLGPRILRTETAGLIALSIIMYELGDLGGN